MISTFYEKISFKSNTNVEDIKILCVGLCCLDVVQLCKEYPLEDTDQRCINCKFQRGGNASNNCTILSQLGSSTEFLGVLYNDQFLKLLQDDMNKFKIDYSNCPINEEGLCPLSTVILSLSTGSRTIIHNNSNKRELHLDDFEKLNLNHYSWIHFEGRNTSVVLSMMQNIENHNKLLVKKDQLPITISLELEKDIPELMDCLPYTDVAFVSKDFAISRGRNNMRETLETLSQEAKIGITIFSAWGDRGAMARAPDGSIVQSPSFPPQDIIDTLGAGDVFNAAAIHYINKEKISYYKTDLDSSKKREDSKIEQKYNIESSENIQTEFIKREILQAAVTFGCRVAGVKIGQRGFDGLGEAFKKCS